MTSTITENALTRGFTAKGPTFPQVSAVLALPVRDAPSDYMRYMVSSLKITPLEKLTPESLARVGARWIGTYVNTPARYEHGGFLLLEPDSGSLRDRRPRREKVPEQLAKAHEGAAGKDTPVAVRYMSPVRGAKGELFLFPKIMVGKLIRDSQSDSVTLETLNGVRTLGVERIESVSLVSSVRQDSMLYYRITVSPGKRNRAILTVTQVLGTELRGFATPETPQAAEKERAELYREAQEAGLFSEVNEVTVSATELTEVSTSKVQGFEMPAPRVGSLSWRELQKSFGEPVRIRVLNDDGSLRRELITELKTIQYNPMNKDVSVGSSLTATCSWGSLEVVLLKEIVDHD